MKTRTLSVEAVAMALLGLTAAALLVTVALSLFSGTDGSPSTGSLAQATPVGPIVVYLPAPSQTPWLVVVTNTPPPPRPTPTNTPPAKPPTPGPTPTIRPASGYFDLGGSDP